DFSEMVHGEAYSINQFFHQPYFEPHYEYGNNDFIELRSTDNVYLHIHQQINGIQSNGIWFTKALNTTGHVFNQTPTYIALINEEALYKDGEQTLNFYVADASGQDEDVDFKIIVDNFPPYLKKLEIFEGDWQNNNYIYSAEWYWNDLYNELQFLPNSYSGVINRNTNIHHWIKFTFSEPMDRIYLTISGLSIYAEVINSSTTNETEFFFLMEASDTYLAPIGDYIIDILGYDLTTTTHLYGFTSTNNFLGSDFPIKQSDGSWYPYYNFNFNDIIHEFTIANIGEPPIANFHASITEINIEESIDFFDDSSENPTAWEWEFEGGDPTTSTAQDPSNIIYHEGGTFFVKLTVTNCYGSYTEIKYDYITVYDPRPVPGFNTSNGITSIEPYSEIDFIDQSTNNPTSWEWEFEGGNPATSTVQNPVDIEYPTTGTYDVSLSVSNEFGTQTLTKYNFIKVTNTPGGLNIDCYTNYYIYTINEVVTFYANVSNGTSPYTYEFNFNNEYCPSFTSSSTFVSRNYSFSNPGIKYLSVTITDNSNPSYSNTCETYITVEEIGGGHNVDFSWEPLSPLYLSDEITFHNLTTGGAEPYLQSYWEWFEDPYSGNQPVVPILPHCEVLWTTNALDDPSTHAIYDELGDYPVKLTVSDKFGWEKTKTKYIHFIPEDECIYFYDGNYGWSSITMWPGEFASVDDTEYFLAQAGCCFSTGCNVQPDYFDEITNIRWKLFFYNGSTYVEVQNSEQYYFDEIVYPVYCEDDIVCNCYWYSQGYGNLGSWIFLNDEVYYNFSQKGDYYIQCEVWNPCYGTLEYPDPNPYTYDNLEPSKAPQLPYYDVARLYFKVVDCDEPISFSIDVHGNQPEIWGGYITLGGSGAHTIHPDAKITYVAHQEISLSDNFTAYKGCEFTARIEPCPDYSKVMDNFGRINYFKDHDSLLSYKNNSDINLVQIKIYPNPNKGEFKIYFTNLSGQYNLEIVNNLGEIIFYKEKIQGKLFTVNISDKPKGIYFLKIKTKDKLFIEKIICH
ncbi:MAG: PKD domain-containing protein, partial [Bacteroidales bacterium]|nr:PKD domain-containing protein [Bacteroidales bacterium]